jgi:hypothetical protein
VKYKPNKWFWTSHIQSTISLELATNFPAIHQQHQQYQFFKDGLRLRWRPIPKIIQIHTMSHHTHHAITTKLIFLEVYLLSCHPPILWHAHIFHPSKLSNSYVLNSKLPFVYVVNIQLSSYYYYQIMTSTHLPFMNLPYLLVPSTPNPWIKSLSSLASWVTSLFFFFCQINSYLIVKIFDLWIFKSFCYMLELDDVGFLKALLPTNLVPSTSTPYLESRLEISYSTLWLVYINGRPPYCQ